MDTFILHNTRTGWQGGVTEKIYYDRIRLDEYVDPRSTKKTAPAAPEKQDAWEVAVRSKGWYNVVRGDEVANDKGLRKAAAEALRDELNA